MKPHVADVDTGSPSSSGVKRMARGYKSRSPTAVRMKDVASTVNIL